MFERLHHRRIGQVLECIDAGLMLKHRCLFGGGTAIALTHGEFRESADIGFICASIDGYRALRGLVHEGGVQALFTRPVTALRGPKIDQYGVRCPLKVDGTPVKFEIVFEGRVALADPSPQDKICGIWALALEDKVATKLMANSDRWADDSVMCRDIIDLAMLAPTGLLDPIGIDKALRAYGPSVINDLDKSRTHLLEREGRLALCMRKMGMTMPIDLLRDRIQALSVKPSRISKAGKSGAR